MIKLYEDNAGALYMTDGAIYASGMEHQPDQGCMVGDMMVFIEWIDDSSNHGDMSDISDTIERETTKLIAQWDGDTAQLFIRRMGSAGLRYAGIDSTLL